MIGNGMESVPKKGVSRALAIVAASIFSTEIILMILFEEMHDLPLMTENLLDAIFLTLLVSPILYIQLFRPLQDNIAELEKTRDLLRNQRDILEEEVSRRTAELMEQNRQQEVLMHDLKSANEELKNFAYVVSHDLKAPLRAIGSLTQWISEDYADKFDEEGREHLRLLVGRTRRMDSLIDGILQYSRVGRVHEELVRVDLNLLLHEIIDSLGPHEAISVEVETSLPELRVEKTRIQQVFQNLISNAMKYIDKPQGEVRIGCIEENDDWKFYVRDNGPGIEERHFERIFHLFQTLAPRDRVESTGVGLALVRKIVEMHGGKVWLESAVGKGSTFYFTLPLVGSIEREGVEVNEA